MMKWDIRLKIGIVALVIGGILYCFPEGSLPEEMDTFSRFCLRLGAVTSFWGMFYMMRREKYGA
jgi:hypothetical protein